MILHLYFARKFLRIFAAITLLFFLLLSLIDLVDQLRRYTDSDVSFGQIVVLVLLNVQDGLYTFMPLVMILATATLFLGLSRTSELVVTRAAGRSALRSLVAPAFVALIIGTLALAIYNPIVAATTKRYSELSESYRTGGGSILSISAEGLWLRQGGSEGQTVIRAARSNAEATTLYDLTLLTYAPGAGPVRRIEARSAAIANGAWPLKDAKVWPLGRNVNAEAESKRFEFYEVPSDLTESRIRDTFGKPSAISFWDLPDYIQQLEAAGFSARRHAVWYQMELSKPLFMVAMVLISAAFTMRHVRFGRTGVAVLTAILLGFALYYIRNFAQILGQNGQIPIMLAAWAPPAASILLALGLLLHMEDG